MAIARTNLDGSGREEIEEAKRDGEEKERGGIG